MDAIKKKMVSLSTETDTATARANKFDDEALAASRFRFFTITDTQ